MSWENTSITRKIPNHKFQITDSNCRSPKQEAFVASAFRIFALLVLFGIWCLYIGIWGAVCYRIDMSFFKKTAEVSTDAAQIRELLTRGVERVFPSAEFLEKQLRGDKRLSLYLGIDPTGPTLHIGHVIPLLKLRQFQELGHRVILLIGDFTGMIGDPTDKSAARKRLTRAEVHANAKLYKSQASKLISFIGSLATVPSNATT